MIFSFLKFHNFWRISSFLYSSSTLDLYQYVTGVMTPSWRHQWCINQWIIGVNDSEDKTRRQKLSVKNRFSFDIGPKAEPNSSRVNKLLYTNSYINSQLGSDRWFFEIFCVGVRVVQPTSYRVQKNQFIKPVRMIPIWTLRWQIWFLPVGAYSQQSLLYFISCNQNSWPVKIRIRR